MTKKIIDYKYKSEVMSSPKFSTILQLRKKMYFANKEEELFSKNNEFLGLYDLILLNDQLLLEDVRFYKETLKINHARINRAIRLKDFIKSMLALGNCIFVTITFTDSYLESTTPQSRRLAVRRYLSKISPNYVANIDFGVVDVYTAFNGEEKHGSHREHYHAVVQSDRVTELWNHGFTYFEMVRNTDNPIQLARYVSKLVNHAIKESTKRNYCIYSRNR